MPALDGPTSQAVRFGLFEVDLAARELRRQGKLIKLQDRPFELLAVLLERPGEVVTREEFRRRLWPVDTFVDFDASLNTSVNKLRQALSDSAENPRFIATSGRKGYRFIAPISIEEGTPPLPVVGTNPRAEERRPRLRLYAVLSLSTVVVAAIVATLALRPQPLPKVLDLVQITHDGLLDPWGKLTTDGARIFYLDHAGSRWTLMQAPASGGEAQPFAQPQNTRVVDIAPDRADLLSFTFVGRSDDLPLWLTPVVGGPARRAGNIVANDAVFARDGRRIFFSRSDGIYSCERDGSAVKKLVDLPRSSEYLRWSPDGQRLRFTEIGPGSNQSSIWEVSANGDNLHEVNLNLLQPGSPCCGRWSNDGRYFFFTLTRNNLHSIWAIRDSGRAWLSRAAKPVQLTFGPENYGGLITGADSNRIFVWGGNEQFDITRYYPQSGRIQPLLPGIHSLNTSLSPDGAWLTFTAGGDLWRSRADGSMRQSLVSGYSSISQVQWSPDGTRILFHVVDGAQLDKFLVVPVEGGPSAELVLGSGHNEPYWSPDGKSIVFAKWADGETKLAQSGIFLLDPHTSVITRVPDSEGLIHPRFSPDRRFLAAVTNFDQEPSQPTRVMLLDTQTRSWREIARGALVNPVVWSADSKDFYYQDVLAENQPAFRFSAATGKSNSFVDFADLLRAGYARCVLEGFAPDGTLIVSLRRNEVNIYRLDLDLP